jgi:GT2 family glycosyltransferase
VTDAPKAEVLIGVPTLNGPERLARCLEAIRRHTPMGALGATLLVSDDCSYEGNLEANKRVCANYGVEMLMAPTRYGVATQWNRLTRHTDAPIIVLMNDDVEVVPDWLEALVFTIRNNPHAGLVGLKAFEGVNSMNFTPPLVHSYNEAALERGLGMLSATGFLFGFSRDKFDAVGGFDEGFFCFYEEMDLGVRLLDRGWPSYLLSYPIVIHQGGATTSDLKNIEARRVMAESKAKFMAKHGSIERLRAMMLGRDWPKPVQWNTMLKTWTD